MRKELKSVIEELVTSSIKSLKSLTNLNLKRIVIYSSIPVLNELLVFNYTQNQFYNQQFIIDKKIPIEIIKHYQYRRDVQEGDYSVDIGAYLKKTSIKDSAFLDY